MTRLVLGLLIAGSLLWSQPSSIQNSYTATCDATLAAATTACTIQQPASSARTVQFVEAFISTAAATDITFTCNGTAATATAVDRVRNDIVTTPTAAATAFGASDVGAGTACGPTLPFAASTSNTLNLDGYILRGAGTAKNFTIRASSMTGRIVIVIKWKEF